MVKKNTKTNIRDEEGNFNRPEIIRQLEELAKSDTVTYDVAKMPAVIAAINSATEEDINNMLILGKYQNMLARSDAFVFTAAEIDKVKQAITACGRTITNVDQLTKDDDSRDDYCIRYDGTGDAFERFVWVGKIRPLFDSKPYVLLAVEGTFPSSSYDDVDRLCDAIKRSF